MQYNLTIYASHLPWTLNKTVGVFDVENLLQTVLIDGYIEKCIPKAVEPIILFFSVNSIQIHFTIIIFYHYTKQPYIILLRLRIKYLINYHWYLLKRLNKGIWTLGNVMDAQNRIYSINRRFSLLNLAGVQCLHWV